MPTSGDSGRYGGSVQVYDRARFAGPATAGLGPSNIDTPEPYAVVLDPRPTTAAPPAEVVSGRDAVVSDPRLHEVHSFGGLSPTTEDSGSSTDPGQGDAADGQALPTPFTEPDEQGEPQAKDPESGLPCRCYTPPTPRQDVPQDDSDPSSPSDPSDSSNSPDPSAGPTGVVGESPDY